jgi:hypothetical protein
MVILTVSQKRGVHCNSGKPRANAKPGTELKDELLNMKGVM